MSQTLSTTRESRSRFLADLILILAGSTITAFATKYIFDPAGLVTGGVSGLAIVVKYLSGLWTGYEFPLWLSNLVLNIPIFLFAIYVSGLKSILRTALCWAIMTLELMVMPAELFRMPQDNLLLTSIYGGLLFGLGTGLLLSARATSGGTDLLGNTLHKYFRHYSQGRLIEFLDAAVVVIGAVVFSVEHTLFAIISVFIMGRVIDYVLGRGKSARLALIISEESEAISADILTELDRGVTALPGRGMYSGSERTMLMCVCSERDVVAVKDIVRRHDPRAFMTIGNVSEAMGEGFSEG